MKVRKEYSIPKWLKVEPFGKHSGWGEDDPIWPERLRRDGWTCISYPSDVKLDFGANVVWQFSSPLQWQKRNPKFPGRYLLNMSIVGVHEKGGPWYMTNHSVIHGNRDVTEIGRSDWADWDHSGDLLFAKDGCLYRLRCKRGLLDPLDGAKKIADFSNMKFEMREAPREVLRWT
jgi:hypothetical protein